MKKTNHENVFHFIRRGINDNVCMPIQMTTIHAAEGIRNKNDIFKGVLHSPWHILCKPMDYFSQNSHLTPFKNIKKNHVHLRPLRSNCIFVKIKGVMRLHLECQIVHLENQLIVICRHKTKYYHNKHRDYHRSQCCNQSKQLCLRHEFYCWFQC